MDRPSQRSAAPAVPFMGDPDSAGPVSPRARELTARLIGFDDIDGLPEAPPDLVAGWLPSGGLAVLYGDPGVGKTFVGLDLAVAVALRSDWHGRPVARGMAPDGVIYVACEGGAGLIARLRAIETCLDDPPDPLCSINILPATLDLHRPVDTEALTQVARSLQIPLRLIVIDTVSRVMGEGHENDTRDMAALVRNCARLTDATGATVLLLHHAGKSTDLRGSTVLRAAADVIIRLSRHQSGVATARIEKRRDGPEGEAFHFRLREVPIGRTARGDPITSAIVEPCDAPRAAAPRGKRGTDCDGLSARDQAALDALIAAERAFPADHSVPGIPGVPLERWKDECGRRRLTPSDNASTQRTAFFKAKSALENRGLVVIEGDLVRRVSE